MTLVRAAGPADRQAIWAILEPMFRAGETYCVEPDIGREAALAYWMDAPHSAFVAEREGAILGSYFLTPNQRGGGAHVANCGYATAPEAEGQGIVRAMLDHSLDEARARGFRAMQYNFVVATNRRALATWQRNGFEIVGRLPGAFRHPRLGFVDACVLYRAL